MFKGFKDFIMCGNVIDLAAGVVISPAFTAIVATFTDSLPESLLNTIGGAEIEGLDFEIISGNPSTYLDFAAVTTVVINLLLVVTVVYLVIVASMNKFNKIREARSETSAEPEVTEADPLTEIRDLLTEQDGKSKTELN